MRCERCKNWRPLVFAQIEIMVKGYRLKLIKYACRFGEKPSTCCEYKEKR